MEETNMTYNVNLTNANQGVEAMEIFEKECEKPLELTTEFLMKLLEDNKDTEYGKKYDFANIHSIEEYQKKVPVIVYDDIAQDLERMMRGEKNILTAYPFDHMNETSGTVGNPKVVPMTDRQSEIYLKYNNNNMYGVLKKAMKSDEWMHGRGFCTSSGTHHTLESGITVGEAASKMADYIKGGKAALDQMIRTLYTSPVEGLAPEPGTNVKYIHARFALMDEDVRGIVSGFYSVIVLYLQYIADNYELLINDIETGTISDEIEMPEDVRKSLTDKLSPMPERAAKLREIFKNGSDFKFVKKIWPKFSYLCGAGGDGFAIYDELLKNHYIGECENIYSGITSSEGLWSVPFEANNTSSAIAAGAAFLEFLPVEAGDDFSKCVTLDKVEVGKIYELIITNVNGFYRYRMSDAVKITGHYINTPTVEFMYRVNRTINLAEEKTTEKALQVTCENVAKEMGFSLADFSVYPDTSVIPNKYVFLIEPKKEVVGMDMKKLQECVFKHLIEANPVYNDCYVEKWLDMPDVYFLQPETSLLYRDMMVAKGASLNQLKPVRVIMNEKQRKFFFSLRDM